MTLLTGEARPVLQVIRRLFGDTDAQLGARIISDCEQTADVFTCSKTARRWSR
ncbi:hypothetical protein [Rhodococcus koreensis]|uniref:hypothetical protein n=1 Tax=Rhodococcus koreensis TaxID=99653 RepID=UPI00366A5C98